MPDEDFYFLGYEIRDVTHARPAKLLWGASPERLFSVDRVICTRYEFECLGDLPVGTFGTLREALLFFSKVPAVARPRHEVLGLSVETRALIWEGRPNEEVAYSGVQVVRGAVLAPCFRLAGYDVASVQYSAISALTNCGPDLPAACVDPRADLSETCLLKDVAKARELAAHADKGVPEHAPFHVWQVWVR